MLNLSPPRRFLRGLLLGLINHAGNATAAYTFQGSPVYAQRFSDALNGKGDLPFTHVIEMIRFNGASYLLRQLADQIDGESGDPAQSCLDALGKAATFGAADFLREVDDARKDGRIDAAEIAHLERLHTSGASTWAAIGQTVANLKSGGGLHIVPSATAAE